MSVGVIGSERFQKFELIHWKRAALVVSDQAGDVIKRSIFYVQQVSSTLKGNKLFELI